MVRAGDGLRVVMVIQRFRPEFSGQGIQVEQLCQALARRGARPVIVSAIEGQPSGWEICEGYRVRRVRTDLPPEGARPRRLRGPIFGARVFFELLRMPADIVHVHGLNDGIYGAFGGCTVRKTPLVFEMTLMGVDDPSSALASRQRLAGARHRVYRSCDGYVAMSRAFLPAYAAAGMPQERLHVIPQGVDTRRFRPATGEDRQQLRRALGFGPANAVIAFVGSLIERKGFDVLLTAFGRVHQRRPDARLLLVGRDTFPADSAEQRFLDQQLARLDPGLKAAVVRAGLRDDPERVLRASDMFVFPSRREGFGSAVIEAMACGLPCVVTRLPGITDFVFSEPIDQRQAGLPGGGDGIVVEQDDSERIASALTALIDNPQVAAGIGEAGRRTANARFDLDQVIAPAYEQLYAGLVHGRRNGR
jgi:glycosyltransferase involved in cell wall biosynthesis